MLELSQMIANLRGVVSTNTLISQLEFVEDPLGELEAVKNESKDNLSVFNNQSYLEEEENEDISNKETE